MNAEHDTMQAAFDRLGERFFLAAEECCLRKYGEQRNGRGIVAVAVEQCISPVELLALFGFLPHHDRPAGHYVDMLQEDNCDDMGLLPKDDERTAIAFTLSRVIANDKGLSYICE